MAWPSGHMTAAAALALALILVVPERWRTVATAAGALWVVAIGGTILLLGMHLLSDVVAGMLIAGAWAGLAVAALRVWAAPAPSNYESGHSRLVLPVTGAAAVAVTAGVIAAGLADDQHGPAPTVVPLAIIGGGLVVTGLAVVIVGLTAIGAPADAGSTVRRG